MNELIRKLNSMTKYPSIETFHVLGQKGRLTDERRLMEGEVFLTEKVDGTNARLIMVPRHSQANPVSTDAVHFPCSYLLGSREEFLYCFGDILYQKTQNIVEAIRELASALQSQGEFMDGSRTDIIVLFLEVYGRGTGNGAKRYTKNALGYRLFDVVRIPDETVRELLEKPIEQIASWRDNGGQDFLSVEKLKEFAACYNLPLVPYIGSVDASALPMSHDDTLAWLRETLPTTLAKLDGDGTCQAEGIVLRSADRKQILKAKFEDYERTLRTKK